MMMSFSEANLHQLAGGDVCLRRPLYGDMFSGHQRLQANEFILSDSPYSFYRSEPHESGSEPAMLDLNSFASNYPDLVVHPVNQYEPLQPLQLPLQPLQLPLQPLQLPLQPLQLQSPLPKEFVYTTDRDKVYYMPLQPFEEPFPYRPESSSTESSTPPPDHLSSWLENEPMGEKYGMVGAAGVFPCAECGREYRSLSSLKCHQRNGHQPCPECGKLLSSRASLQEHRFLHTGERPFLCTECGMSYVRRRDLKRHVKVRHPCPSAPSPSPAPAYRPVALPTDPVMTSINLRSILGWESAPAPPYEAPYAVSPVVAGGASPPVIPDVEILEPDLDDPLTLDLPQDLSISSIVHIDCLSENANSYSSPQPQAPASAIVPADPSVVGAGLDLVPGDFALHCASLEDCLSSTSLKGQDSFSASAELSFSCTSPSKDPIVIRLSRSKELPKEWKVVSF